MLQKDTGLLRYNWNRLYKYSKQDCTVAVNALKAYLKLKRLTKKENYILQRMLEEKQDSWILKPISLFTHKASTISEKCIYLFLASKRDYNQYLSQGIDFIPTFIVEDKLNIDYLENNSLLTIEDEIIRFKY